MSEFPEPPQGTVVPRSHVHPTPLVQPTGSVLCQSLLGNPTLIVPSSSISHAVKISTPKDHFIDVTDFPTGLSLEQAKVALKTWFHPHHVSSRSGGTPVHRNYKCQQCASETFLFRLTSAPDGNSSIDRPTEFRLQLHRTKRIHQGHGQGAPPSKPGLHPLIAQRIEDMFQARNLMGLEVLTPVVFIKSLLAHEDTRLLPEIVTPSRLPKTQKQIQNYMWNHGNRLPPGSQLKLETIDDTTRFRELHKIVIPETYVPGQIYESAPQFADALGYLRAHSLIILPTPSRADLQERLTLPHLLGALDAFRLGTIIIFTSPSMLYTLFEFATTIAFRNKILSADGTYPMKDGSVVTTVGGIDMCFRLASGRLVTRSLRPFASVSCSGHETSVSVAATGFALELVATRLWGLPVARVIRLIFAQYVSIDKSKSFCLGFRLLNINTEILNCFRHLLASFLKGKDYYNYFSDKKYCQEHAIEHLQLLTRCKSYELFEKCFEGVMDLWRDAGEGVAAYHLKKGYGPHTNWYGWFIGCTRHGPDANEEDFSPIPDSQPHESYYGHAKPDFLKQRTKKEDFFGGQGVHDLLKLNMLKHTGCTIVAPTSIQPPLLSIVAMMDPSIDLLQQGDVWYVNAHAGIGTAITVARIKAFEAFMTADVTVDSANAVSVLQHVRDLCRVRYIEHPSVPDLHYQCPCKLFSLRMECPGTMLVKDSLAILQPPLSASFIFGSQKYHRNSQQLGPYPTEASVFAEGLSLVHLHPFYQRHHIRALTEKLLKALAKYRCVLSFQSLKMASRYMLLPLLLCYRQNEVRPPNIGATHPLVEDAEEPPSGLYVNTEVPHESIEVDQQPPSETSINGEVDHTHAYEEADIPGFRTILGNHSFDTLERSPAASSTEGGSLVHSPDRTPTKILLVVGDTICHYHPLNIAFVGEEMTTRIIGIDPSSPNLPLNLRNGHAIPLGQLIRLVSGEGSHWLPLGDRYFTFEKSGMGNLEGFMEVVAGLKPFVSAGQLFPDFQERNQPTVVGEGKKRSAEPPKLPITTDRKKKKCSPQASPPTRPWEKNNSLVESRRRQKIQLIWSTPETQDLMDARVGCHSGIYRVAFKTLQPGQWLSEEAGDKFISLFREWLLQHPQSSYPCCLVGSSFLRCLGNISNFQFVEVDDSAALLKRYKYQEAKQHFLSRRAQRGFGDLLGFGYVLMPYCGEGHWFLVVVDVVRREIYALDSMHDSRPAMCGLVHKFVCDYEQEFGQPTPHLPSWRVRTDKCSVGQNNGVDCGIFVLLNIMQISLQDGAHAFRFGQADMDNVRWYVAHTILTKVFILDD
jgi:hypothetical protein